MRPTFTFTLTHTAPPPTWVRRQLLLYCHPPPVVDRVEAVHICGTAQPSQRNEAGGGRNARGPFSPSQCAHHAPSPSPPPSPPPPHPPPPSLPPTRLAALQFVGSGKALVVAAAELAGGKAEHPHLAAPGSSRRDSGQAGRQEHKQSS